MSRTTPIFILIGPPNGGKGTQATLMSQKYRLLTLSSSDLIKEHSNSPENQEAIKNGKLIDDETVNNVMKDAITYNIGKQKGIIIDGYPRNLVQSKYLDDIISGLDVRGYNIDTHILYVRVAKQELLDRVKYRIICDGKTETLKKINSDSIFNITTTFKEIAYKFIFNINNYTHPFSLKDQNDIPFNNIPFNNTFLLETEDHYLYNKSCFKREDDSAETSNRRIDDFFRNKNAIMGYFQIVSSYSDKIITSS